MLITCQLLLILLINLSVHCARVAIGKTGVGPVQLGVNTDSKGYEAPDETLGFQIERKTSGYDYEYKVISSRQQRELMDIYPSQYPEDPIASDALEEENLELGFESPDLEESISISTGFMETGEQDVVTFPSSVSEASSTFDLHPSETLDFDSVMPPFDLGVQPSEAPEFGILPSRSPVPFIGVGISASTVGTSAVLSGRTTPSRVVGITVTVLVVFGTLLTVVTIALYGRNINPYRPFITGASLSEGSFDFVREAAPETSNEHYNSRESNSKSRRYEANSLNRDIEPAQRLEAARLLEDIPDRHCR